MAVPATPLAALSRTRNPLVLWHLLSLDAPTVAVVWLLFVARTTHTALPPVLPLTLFLAVWLIYTSDRLLDARTAPASLPSKTAHTFHRAHRLAFTLTAAFATLLLALLLPALPAVLLGRYLLLAIALFLWLILIHFGTFPMPKAYAPGIFFAAAVFVPTLGSQPILTLLPQAAAFAALGILNCLFIQFWERHPQPTSNLPLKVFAFTLLATPALFATNVTLPVYLSVAALLLLGSQRTRLHPLTLRAAADLALLTPILISTLSL